MTLARANAGGWALRDRLLSSQLNAMDINGASAVDAVGGGPIAPSSIIAVGGAGLSLTASGVAGRLQYASRSITRMVPIIGSTNDATRWVNSAAGGAPAYSWITFSTVGGNLWFQLDGIPNGATVTQLRLRMKGATGHTYPINTLPAFSFSSWSYATDTETVVGTTSDTNNTAPTYEVFHWIALGSLSTVVDHTTKRYYIKITGESGANSLVGALYTGVEATFTMTDQSEAL